MSTPPSTCVTAPALALTGLVKRFGEVTAVDHLDLHIAPGEIVAILGPNGAGKTTTIDMLLGLSRPDAGTVSLFGGTAADAVALGRVSAVLQSGGLLADLTVAETVRLIAALHGRPKPVAEVLERAGIGDLAARRVGVCSGGQQQRLRFAMALVSDPDLIVLDEPTTGMDVEGRREFWAAIRQDARDGRTVLFATHYLDEADDYADRIVVVRAGRVVADGTPAQVRAVTSGRFVQAHLPAADTTALLSLPGVSAVEQRGERVLIRTDDSDAIARHLLTTTAARDLEITTTSLEDAFLALTTPVTTTLGSPA
ncbi:MAG: ABC transporter ATP-binding protein [Dermatophilaceae bacterium]